MAQIIARGFRLIRIIDLTDLTKAPVDIEQVTTISHDASTELDERTYEDNLTPNISIIRARTGNITIAGDVEKYVHPTYVTGTRTAPLFVPENFYLIRFLALDATSVAEMIYSRWIGQLIEPPKPDRSAGELTDREIILKISQFGDKSFDFTKFYNATADGSPGPVDSAPADDYNPIFTAIVSNSTKTLTAAETELGTVTNPE